MFSKHGGGVLPGFSHGVVSLDTGRVGEEAGEGTKGGTVEIVDVVSG